MLNQDPSGQSPAAVAAKIVAGALQFKGVVDRCAAGGGSLQPRLSVLQTPLGLVSSLACLALPLASRPGQASQHETFCAGCSYHSEQLTPDSTKEGPLCMNQFARLFGHARIPRAGRDDLVRGS